MNCLRLGIGKSPMLTIEGVLLLEEQIDFGLSQSQTPKTQRNNNFKYYYLIILNLLI